MIESLFFPCAHFVHTNPLEMLNPISAVIFFVVKQTSILFHNVFISYLFARLKQTLVGKTVLSTH